MGITNNKYTATKIFVILAVGIFFLVLPGKNVEAAGSCFCVASGAQTASCIPAVNRQDCETKTQCSSATWEGNDTSCDAAVQSFNNSLQFTPGATTPSQPQTPSPVVTEKSTLSELINLCGQEKMDERCYDVTVFISLGLDLTKYMFGIIGSVALLFFVYGGFVFILSQGNPDRVKKGKDILVSAVIGIVIAFSGYAIIRFVGTVVGIKTYYTLF